jgi:hypothetical protein
MSKLEFRYNIRSDLPPCPEDPAALGTRFLGTVDALSRIEPKVFHDWQVMRYPAAVSLPLEAARPRITSIIENAVYRNDLRQPQPQYGYTVGAFVTNADKSRNVSLRVKTGGERKGDTSLETGDWKVFPDPAIVTCPLFRAALLAINANWPPIWACAYAFRLNSVEVPIIYPNGARGFRSETLPMIPSEPAFKDSIFHVPWIAYLSAPLAAGVKLPREIITEHTPDGGLLMVATTDRLDPENAEHLRQARLILETMLARTGYSTYAVQHG